MMPWLKLNMEANTGLRGLVQTRTLYWGDPVAKELLNADVILGADIMYASSVHCLLLKTLLALSKEDTGLNPLIPYLLINLNCSV